MNRAGSLRVVGEEISKYKLDLVGVQEVRWANINSSMENGMKIMNYVQVFSYIRESNQQLRRQSLLVIGCHTYY
jgi:hypothetical protein